MKRIIAAVLLAALAVPAFAFETGAPFEQTQLDRQLPNVKDPVADQASSGGTVFGSNAGAPYEQNRIDMALPNVKDPVVAPRTQFAGPAKIGRASCRERGEIAWVGV